MTETQYVLEGTRHEAELECLRMMEEVLDPGTRACLLATGLRKSRPSPLRPRSVNVGASPAV